MFWSGFNFQNLKHATGSIFVYSIQLSTYLFKRVTCKFVCTPSHYRVCFCMYILPIIKVYFLPNPV